MTGIRRKGPLGSTAFNNNLVKLPALNGYFMPIEEKVIIQRKTAQLPISQYMLWAESGGNIMANLHARGRK